MSAIVHGGYYNSLTSAIYRTEELNGLLSVFVLIL